MTENDYIAEYIKERYHTLLGFDFTLWKMGRVFTNAGRKIVETFNTIDWSKLNLPDDESEESDADSN